MYIVLMKSYKNNKEWQQMETIEQTNIEEVLEKYTELRRKYTIEEIGEAYGCSKQNIETRVKKLKSGLATPRTVRKFNAAFKKLKKEE